MKRLSPKLNSDVGATDRVPILHRSSKLLMCDFVHSGAVGLFVGSAHAVALLPISERSLIAA